MLCRPPSEKCVVSRQGWTRSACGRAPGLEAKLARGPALPGLADPPEAGPSLTAGTGARIPLLLGVGLRPGILRRTESPWNAWHSARLLLHSSILKRLPRFRRVKAATFLLESFSLAASRSIPTMGEAAHSH